jgi:hypothetical protein
MIGDIVHYVSHGTPLREDGSQAFPSECRAAMITQTSGLDPEEYGLVAANAVGLHVVNPTGQFFRSLADGGSVHSQLGAPGSWHTLTECELVRGQHTYGKAV